MRIYSVEFKDDQIFDNKYNTDQKSTIAHYSYQLAIAMPKFFQQVVSAINGSQLPHEQWIIYLIIKRIQYEQLLFMHTSSKDI